MDRVTPAVRSKIMAAVKTRNSTTELRMAAVLRSNSLTGYRKHWRVIGTPDFAWPGLKLALFVDGCFWHGCPYCRRYSRSNLGYWQEKIHNNRDRDKRVSRALRRQGWAVLRVWECRIESTGTANRLAIAIEKRQKPA